ncbi:MAG: hypothetical protein QG622_3537 [Actinomycetota bacterium]|nr:hypothetical protein [Actinomycetota bacterium]
MAFRPYATRPLRLAVQVTGDLLMLAWTYLWVTVAISVHDLVVALASAGFRLRDGAGGIAGYLRDAGADAARIPVAGDDLAAPLRSAGGAATNVANAGQQLGDGVTSVATPLALAVAGAMILPFAVPWLLARWRYARRAGATAVLARTPAGTRLLALRALATAPPRRLTAIDPDPVSAWVRQDDRVIAALAGLELRRAGRRPPSPARSGEGPGHR